jgi:hypothetical protein
VNKRIVVWIGLVFNALNILSIVIAYIAAPEIAKPTILKAGVLFVAIVCAGSYLLLSFWLLRRKKEHLPDVPSTPAGPQTTKNHIYIGPSGTPVSIENGKIKVDLKFFSCTPVRLLHVKAYVGTSPRYATLSDGEPDEIRAGDVFTKILEEKLESGMRSSLLMQRELGPINVQGTAKFSDGTDGQTFHFDAVPLFLRRDQR